MNLNVNSILSGCNYYSLNKNRQQNIQKQNNMTFHGAGKTKLLGYSLLAAAMIPVSSCDYTKRKLNPSEEVVKVVSTSEKTDSSYSTMGEYYYKDNHIRRMYHYFPTDEAINCDNYSWSETIYPDGKIEKDSMGYYITITPEGERTTVYTETDNNGNVTKTTTSPDLSKIVHTDYKTNNPNDTLYSETRYRPNGSRIDCKIYHEFSVNDSLNKSEKKIEQSIKRYNDKNILLTWYSDITDSLRSEKNNKYDKKRRLIYNDMTQEIFEYKKNSKIPYRSLSICEDCERIKLYYPNGKIKKDFFKASDGTITPAKDSIM